MLTMNPLLCVAGLQTQLIDSRNAIAILVDALANAPSIDTRRNVARAISNMTRYYDEVRELFLEQANCIEALVRLVTYEQDTSVPECALRALVNLALCCMLSRERLIRFDSCQPFDY
jgi:hypothetical protein